MRRIVIVGGGFSGTALAIQLLRQRHREYTRIVLVDSVRPGRGVAYRADAQDLLLNVRAGSMGVCEEDPGGFVTYARTLGLLAEPSDFLPRSLFGAYVEAELARHIARAPKDVRFAFVRGEAIELEQRTDGPGFRLWLADGRSLHAHAVIVATGNPPPARLAPAQGLGIRDGYVADPWREPAPPIAGRVLLIGTGLTMIDTALRLSANGGTRCVAVSRRGLLPRVHPGAVPPWSPPDPAALQRAAATVRGLVRFIRTTVREQAADPQAVVRTLRAIAPHIWRRWSRAERARFLRHVRIYWDVHRHLQPPAVARRIDALRSEGRLQLQAARLLDLRAGRHGLEATLLDRVTGHAAEHEFDWVVNCTGPQLDPRGTRNPLLAALLRDGWCVPDPLGLGVLTAANGALSGRSGKPAERLFYIGPMLRADRWEATAVPELRVHARRLAREIVAALDQPERRHRNHAAGNDSITSRHVTYRSRTETELSPTRD